MPSSDQWLLGAMSVPLNLWQLMNTSTPASSAGQDYSAMARLVSILARLFVAANSAKAHWQLHLLQASA